MTKAVCVIESPYKGKLIKEYLEKHFKNGVHIVSTEGHIKKLNIKTPYEITDSKKINIFLDGLKSFSKFKSALKAKCQSDSIIIIASDPDIEGEFIGECVKREAEQLPNCGIYRFKLNEITQSEIDKNISMIKDSSKMDIDQKTLSAFYLRSLTDYSIGFLISKAIWIKLVGCTSVGRVQSATLGLLCKKYEEINNFKPTTTFNVILNDRLVHKFKKEEYAKEFCQQLKDNSISYKISAPVNITVDSPKPFDTVSAISYLNRKLQVSPSSVSIALQKLYELGFLTYSRTDSSMISYEAIPLIQKELNKIDLKYIKHKCVKPQEVVKTSKKLSLESQGGHEAIRPTFKEGETSLDHGLLKIYKAIKEYTLGIFLGPLVFSSRTISMDFLGKEIKIQTMEDILEPGFSKLIAYQISGYHKMQASDFETMLDKMSYSEVTTKPPSRFTEIKVIETMKKNGIGRPSTYRHIVKVLIKRRYAIMAKDKKVHITCKGVVLCAFINKHLKELLSVETTKELEKNIDMVMDGQRYEPVFIDYLENVKKHAEEITKVDKIEFSKHVTDLFSKQKCPECGSKMNFVCSGKYFAYCTSENCKKTSSFINMVHTQTPSK